MSGFKFYLRELMTDNKKMSEEERKELKDLLKMLGESGFNQNERMIDILERIEYRLELIQDDVFDMKFELRKK